VTQLKNALVVLALCVGFAALAGGDKEKEKPYGSPAAGMIGDSPLDTQSAGRGGSGMVSASLRDQVAAWTEGELLWQLKEGHQAEVDLAKIAEKQATNVDIKDFAKAMVRDHRQGMEEVTDAAKSARIDLREPKTPDRAQVKEKHNAMKDELKALSGSAFDQRFISVMVDDHQKMTEVLSAAETRFAKPAVKTLVAKQLGGVQMHLDKAKNLQRLSGTGGAGLMPDGFSSDMFPKREQETPLPPLNP